MNPWVEFQRIRSLLIGQAPWQLQQGHGSFLTIEIGKAETRQTRDGKPYKRGEWHLWVQHCGWDVFSEKGELLAHEESSKKEISDALSLLKGVEIEDFACEAETFDISFEFAGGMTLALYAPDEDEDDGEYLSVYTPDQHVLVFGPKKNLAYKSAHSRD